MAVVTEMSREEWDDAVQRALARLHLTLDELTRQARDGFRSLEAKKLWMAIGGMGDECDKPYCSVLPVKHLRQPGCPGRAT